MNDYWHEQRVHNMIQGMSLPYITSTQMDIKSCTFTQVMPSRLFGEQWNPKLTYFKWHISELKLGIGYMKGKGQKWTFGKLSYVQLDVDAFLQWSFFSLISYNLYMYFFSFLCLFPVLKKVSNFGNESLALFSHWARKAGISNAVLFLLHLST